METRSKSKVKTSKISAKKKINIIEKNENVIKLTTSVDDKSSLDNKKNESQKPASDSIQKELLSNTEIQKNENVIKLTTSVDDKSSLDNKQNKSQQPESDSIQKELLLNTKIQKNENVIKLTTSVDDKSSLDNKKNKSQQPASDSIQKELLSNTEIPNKIVKEMMLKAESEMYYICLICNGSQPTAEEIYNHLYEHTKQNKVETLCCPKCSIYITKHTVNHFIKDKVIDKCYACSQCPRKFNQATNIVNHLMVHNGDRLFVCELCNSTFRTSSNRKSHYKTHSAQTPFKCDYCEKQFKHAYLLNRCIRQHFNEYNLGGKGKKKYTLTKNSKRWDSQIYF